MESEQSEQIKQVSEKDGRPKKYFTEQEAQEMAKKQRDAAKKRQRLKQKQFKEQLSVQQSRIRDIFNKTIISDVTLEQISQLIEGLNL